MDEKQSPPKFASKLKESDADIELVVTESSTTELAPSIHAHTFEQVEPTVQRAIAADMQRLLAGIKKSLLGSENSDTLQRQLPTSSEDLYGIDAGSILMIASIVLCVVAFAIYAVLSHQHVHGLTPRNFSMWAQIFVVALPLLPLFTVPALTTWGQSYESKGQLKLAEICMFLAAHMPQFPNVHTLQNLHLSVDALLIDFYVRTGQLRKADDALKRCINQIAHIDADRLIKFALFNSSRASINARLGEKSKALELAEQSLDYLMKAKALNDLDSSVVSAAIYNNLGMTLQHCNMYSESLALYSKCLVDATSSARDKDAIISTIIGIGEIFLTLDDLERLKMLSDIACDYQETGVLPLSKIANLHLIEYKFLIDKQNPDQPIELSKLFSESKPASVENQGAITKKFKLPARAWLFLFAMGIYAVVVPILGGIRAANSFDWYVPEFVTVLTLIPISLYMVPAIKHRLFKRKISQMNRQKVDVSFKKVGKSDMLNIQTFSASLAEPFNCEVLVKDDFNSINNDLYNFGKQIKCEVVTSNNVPVAIVTDQGAFQLATANESAAALTRRYDVIGGVTTTAILALLVGTLATSTLLFGENIHAPNYHAAVPKGWSAYEYYRYGVRLSSDSTDRVRPTSLQTASSSLEQAMSMDPNGKIGELARRYAQSHLLEPIPSAEVLSKFFDAEKSIENNELASASQLLDECIKEAPQFLWPYTAKADILIQQNDLKGAKDALEKAKALNEKDSRYLVSLARYQAAAIGNTDDVISLAKQVFENDPLNPKTSAEMLLFSK
ncbi:MAG: hypothetical protein JST89_18945 [Cyanobacteria bacterium SZAS-4]|nr:hypothetical protein [Cyanobacteria bacterium SZAS-4]